MIRSDYTRAMSASFDARTHLRHAMLQRLSIRSTGRPTEAEQADTRTTMQACMGCHRTHACETWLELGGGDVPPVFCPARAVFLRMMGTVV